MLPNPDRPVVRCMIAWPLPDGDFVVKPSKPGEPLLTLEQAEDFAKFGWHVIVDHTTREALVRWEQIQRSLKSTRYSRW